MKKSFFSLVLIVAVSLQAQEIKLSTDSIYRLTVDELALADAGVGYTTQAAILDEILESTHPNAPEMQPVDMASHAQMWTVIAGEGNRFLLQNYRTKRVVWTNRILPQAGKSWKEAAQSNLWNTLPDNQTEDKLCMGPTPAAVNLSAKITYLVGNTHPTAEDLLRGCIMPSGLTEGSLVFVDFATDTPTHWEIEPCYHVDDSDIPLDSGITGIDQATADRPFTQYGSRLVLREACNIYTLIGTMTPYEVGSIDIAQQGIYIVQQASTGKSWKILVD